MSAPILEVRDLSVSFGEVRAVSNVSFSVARNRITTIIGPNGAGKSTLFNLISGAIRPHAGAVLIDGIDRTGEAPNRLRRAGLSRSFQITNLFFDLTVFENLRLAAQFREPWWRELLPPGCSRSVMTEVNSLLNRFELVGQADNRAGELSHGEQRRLEIAVALACQPRLLLLDEPTQGMGHADTAATAALVRSLASEVTIVLIEHDIGLVMDLSHHVVVMHQGEKLAEGTPEQVRADPAVQTAYFGTS
ncbi:MAG: ABC transporter ATP-binding protein [Xanthobacteraceae bacterium]